MNKIFKRISVFTIVLLVASLFQSFSISPASAVGVGQLGPAMSAPAGAPSVPRNVVATALDGASIRVQWAVPENMGDSPIVSYTATTNPGGFSCTTSIVDTLENLGCEIENISTTGVEYEVSVIATNSQGDSPASIPSSPMRDVSTDQTQDANFACWIKGDRTVSCAGDDFQGRIAVPADLGQVLQIGAASQGACALKIDHTVSCWSHELLTPPADLGYVDSITVGYHGACAIKMDHTVACWGFGFLFDIQSSISNLTDVSYVGIGLFTACFVTQQGAISCFGTDDAVNVPQNIGPVKSVAIGYQIGCAVLVNTHVTCWGGVNPSVPDYESGFESISIGISHMCFIRTNHTVYCSVIWNWWEDQTPSYSGLIDRVIIERHWKCLHVIGGGLQCQGDQNTLAFEGYDAAASKGSIVTVANVPSSPQNVTVTRLDRALTVTWEPPLSSGGIDLTNYEVVMTSGSEVRRCNVLASSLSLSCHFTDLNNGNVWQVGVFASNSLGRSAQASAKNYTKVVGKDGRVFCGITAEKDVTCWGYTNSIDELPTLAVPGNVRNVKDLALNSDNTACAVLDTGNLKCWGQGDGQTPPAGLRNVTSIDAGWGVFCAVHDEGVIACWGYSDSSITDSVPSFTNVKTVSVGSSYACALLDDGTVYCWGYGFSGLVNGITDATLVSSGGDRSCAILQDTSIRCWGRDGTIYERTVAGHNTATSLEVSFYSSACVISKAKHVYCDGYNSSGNTSVPDSIASVKSVAVGYNYSSCAVRLDGDIQCWGYPDARIWVPGNIKAAAGRVPDVVSNIYISNFDRGVRFTADTTDSGGYPLLTARYVVSPGNHICEVDLIANLGRTSCIISDLDPGQQYTVTATFTNEIGRSAETNYENLPLKFYSPTGYGCGIDSSNNLRCPGMSEADIPVEMTNLGDVVKFRNSNNSMCTINTAHMLKCWGWWINNWRTQLDELGPVLDISLADNHFCVVLEDTSVRCFGNNDWGVNDVPDGLTDAAKVSVSNWTSCVVKTDGSTQCWGYNSQLPGDLQSAKAIFVNHRHGCILTISDTMQCWGSWNITRIPEALDEPVREITSNDAIMCANTDTKTVCWGDWADYGITYPHLTAIQGNGADAVCGLNETGHVDCQSVWGHRTEMIPVKFKAAPTFTASSGPSQPMIESITWDGNEVDVAFHPSTSTGNGTAITYYGLQDRGVDEYCGFGPDEFSGDGLFHCVFESDPNQAHNFLAIAYNDVGQQSGFLYATSPQDIPLSDKSTSIDVVTNDGEVDSTLVSLTPAVCQVGKATAAYVELTGDDGKRSKILLNSAGTCTLQASASGTQSVLRQFEVLSEQAGHGLDVDVFHWDRWAQQFDEDPSRLCATGQLPNLQYTDQDGIAPLNEDSCGTDHFSMHWKGFIKWPGEYDGVSTSNVKFNAVTDDGQKIIVDGVEVVGSAAGNEGSISDGVEHLSGSIVPFEFWLTEWEGGAYSNVYWNATHTDTDPQQEPRDLIPEAALMRNVSFARAQQTLSWTNQMLYAPTSYLGDYVPLSAQSTAGAVPITFSAAQGSDCTVNGDFAVLSVQNGTCVIEAHSPGDEVTEESNTISIQIHYTVGARSNLWVRNNPRIAHRYRVGDLLAGYDFLEGEIRDSQNRIVYGYYTFAPGNEYAERAGEHDVAGIFHPYNTLRYSEKAVWINYYVQPRDWYDVNEWPTLCDSAVAGMPYSTCELSGGSATVDGHFEYREPNRLFSEGGNYPSIDFVPDDVELEIHTWWWPYVQAQREMRTPVVSVWPTAGVIATGSALSTSVLVGGQADVDGQFQYENPGIVPDNSVTTQTVVFIPSDTYLYNSVTGSVTVSYGLDPEVTTALATDITYGQRLSNSTLSGISGTTPGTYRFASQNTQPDAGDHEFAAWYIPADTSVYYITQVMVPIHVNRATLSKTEDPSVAGLAPLLRLSEIWYSTTGWQSGQFGTYAWDNPNQQIQAGNHSYPITFTPSNINFLPMSLTVVRDVAKLNSTVSIAPLASSIFTSQTLGDSVLSGGLTNTPGTWAWYDPLTNHYGAGIVRPAIVFTPTDSNNYQPTTIEVNLEVLSEDSAIQAELGQTPVASAITYGQQVETSTLSGGSATAGGSSVAGEFVWAHPTTVLAPSNRTQQVTFTPTSAHYLGFTLDVNITGIKRTPFVVHSPQAEGLQVGDSLSDSILTGGETDVEGVWEWLSEDNEVEAGSQTYLARFIPSDSETYSSVSQNIEVTVSKIQSEISLNPEIESELTYGVLLSDITVTGGLATTAGSFAWSDSTIKPEVGDSDQTLVFTPTEANKYLGFSVTVTITVGKAEPTVSGTVSVNPFSYGQALSTVNINGLTSSVPGAWSWTTPTDLPDITDTTAEAVFTPTDSTHYKTVVRQIAIVVNKAQLRLGVKPTPGVLGYGDSISAATVTGGTALLGTLAIPGTWVWQNGATKTVIGTSQQKLSFVPDDTDHFIGFTDVAVALVTGKGSPRVVTYPTVPLVKPGVKVSTVKFTGGKMNVPGKFAWATPTVVVKDNTRVQAFTFTPTDTKKYNSVRVSITLNLMTVPGSPTADPVTPVAYPKAKSTVFKWVAPASNGGSPITKYEYCLTTCTVAKNWKSTALKTTATVAGIPLGATGVVQVRATNAVGSSSPISIAYTQEK